MDNEQKKAATAAYKERKTAAGIFAITCQPSGQSWVGSAPDLAKIQNRIWFALRHNSHRQPSLQAAWAAHGPDAFRFEALEALEEEELGFVRDRLLKEKRSTWCARLGAEAL
ncbi:GIY-YIG nuclease family protein [Ferrovibrio sp.]|uniref:GIY-YIG nuclease family protein n=1 Tax=Ferrovibrio sp. TaxID=1917215 RepID=UPI003D10410B